jgi:hypothetical protein
MRDAGPKAECLVVARKKEFVVWHSEGKKEHARTRRMEKIEADAFGEEGISLTAASSRFPQVRLRESQIGNRRHTAAKA